MASQTVLITGGSGFVAQHLIRYLQVNATDTIGEIRCVDRKKFSKRLDYPSVIPVRHFNFEIKKGNEDQLDRSLNGVSAVFHCAGKAFEYLHNLETDFHDDYFRDNLAATELVLEAMERVRVPNLIFLGDAYANIPVGDNYGISEERHSGIPQSYVLGAYGESKIRAELEGRKAVGKKHENGYAMNGVFLRPTMVYGEGHTSLTDAMLILCKQHKNLPNIEGNNRGLHQFVYAGNLAGMMYKAMLELEQHPDIVSGEYMYCMDCTATVDFKNFIRPYIEASDFRMDHNMIYFQAYSIAYYHEMCYRIGSKQSNQQLSLLAMQFLFGWSIGFSMRKMRLVLGYFPEFDQAESMKRSVEWFAKRGTISSERAPFASIERNQG